MAITDAGAGLSYGAGAFYTYVLRNHYLPEVADGLNHDYVTLSRAEQWQTTDFVQGKNVQHPIHTGRNPTGTGAVGYSSTGARGKLPTPKAQQYNEYQYPVRHHYARILFDGISDDASATDIDSWLRARESEIEGIRDDLSRQENRMIHNDGSGILAVCVNPGATSATLAINNQIPSASSRPDFTPTQFIQVGGRYALVNLSSLPATTVTDVLDVTAKTTTTITYTAISAPAAGTYAIVTANEGSPGSPPGIQSTGMHREPVGLQAICSDQNLAATYFEAALNGTFQGLTVTNNPFNQATISSNGGVLRALTEALLQGMWSAQEKRFQAKITAIIGSFGVRDSFADLLLTYRRQVNKMSLQGGFDTVEYNGVPFIADRDAYSNGLMLLDETDLRQHCMGSKQYRFIDDDGSIYHRLQDEHAFQAALYRRWTHGVFNRGRQAQITDIAELNTVSVVL